MRISRTQRLCQYVGYSCAFQYCTHRTSGNYTCTMSGWLDLLSLEALLFTISIAFILLAMAKERTEYRHRAAARTDPLTGIANRRGFMEQTALSRRTAAGTQPTAVLLFDLDHFKTINDRYGHAVGDRTLQIFADIARAHVGVAGTVGRWGGDEFVAVLYNTSREIAATVAERIQVALERAADDIDGRLVGATVSTGMAFSSHGSFELPAMLLQPVVENAIKFGLYDTTGDITISIEAKKEDSTLLLQVKNPFDPETQDRLSVRVNNQSRNVGGRDCAGYVFEVRNTNGPTARGIAWLEKETGVPVEIANMTLDPLPDKHLKGLAVTTRYELATNGAWRVKEMRTIAKASMLFISFDVHSTITFSEYWKKPSVKLAKENDAK